ncbi:MAG: putative nucleotidyltransferase [Zhongshania aliphaticivorans]|jgi:predicted nucleotidyltransferase|tara:strand:- start:659 stop:1051 length:393 start_codon:yes stop_codon:yes gene_type:complete
MDTLSKKIIHVAQHTDNIAALWLYGSRARQDHHDHSDYDLAVAFSNWEKDPLERRLRPELLALDWHTQLSLPEGTLSIVDLATAPIPLAWNILIEGKLLLDLSPAHRMHQEARIMSRWELDFAYHQRQRA